MMLLSSMLRPKSWTKPDRYLPIYSWIHFLPGWVMAGNNTCQQLLCAVTPYVHDTSLSTTFSFFVNNTIIFLAPKFKRHSYIKFRPPMSNKFLWDSTSATICITSLAFLVSPTITSFWSSWSSGGSPTIAPHQSNFPKAQLSSGLSGTQLYSSLNSHRFWPIRDQ